MDGNIFPDRDRVGWDQGFSLWVVASWWVSFLVFVRGDDAQGVYRKIDFAFENEKLCTINRGHIH